MSGYHILDEPYVAPEANYKGHRVPPTLFAWSVRRRDGSLVFRTETLSYAEELMRRLAHFQKRPGTEWKRR